MHVVLLSPHRDDAAFSCGLLLTALLRAGARLTVVNVCTVSDYAPYLPESGADRIEQVTRARAAEDSTFYRELAALAGVDASAVQEIDLGWRDAPLRLGLETKQVLVGNSLIETEVDALALAFAKLPAADVVLAPRGIGGHIDHRLVRESALRGFNRTLCLYEDLPYAARLTETEAASVPVPAGMQPWTPPPGGAAGDKRRLARCYPSQIAPEVADEMEQYGRQHGCRERFYAPASLLPSLAELVAAAKASHGVTR